MINGTKASSSSILAASTFSTSAIARCTDLPVGFLGAEVLVEFAVVGACGQKTNRNYG